MFRSKRPLEGVKKIAVLRANAIGDLVFALPALDALRAAYPEAEITLLGQPWHERFLKGRPGPIDRVIVVPNIRALYEERERAVEAGEQEKAAFFQAMQEEHFDLAIQMHGGGRNSNPFLFQLKARITAGMCTPDAPRPQLWMRYLYFQPEVLRCLEVASLAGAVAPVRLQPTLQLTGRDMEESEAVLPRNDTSADERPMVVLNPGAGDPRRRWPVEKFAAVGDALAVHGFRILVTGAAFDAHLTGGVVGSMTAPAEDLAGRLSLGGLAALFSRCRLAVSNDSGPLHIAEAVGTDTVGIYWCGNLIIADPITRSRHRPLLSWRLHCPACGVNTIEEQPCSHRDSFVAEVPVELVLDEAFDLLGLVEQHEMSIAASISK